ncbi:hypothetical protein SDRG_01428 [Saprolegnia diclina VS20]|uniref:EF-hand domain-containing protein n=1 Tax=Saprolegnia diclina (strain VS20) TaxID=1156394 RepID=T0R3F2_SAPDV|nr:hypothetical protein SDRG_01428 [Saprolegnia diclina VS20]EQC41461.1 hypothetical protein SDRG_01428 [Saprolegnia diclina VS20]|eukprot:XP_008605175.1 hypothetical protein SDRG_01428 [Saprolegnia diclina VS20]
MAKAVVPTSQDPLTPENSATKPPVSPERSPKKAAKYAPSAASAKQIAVKSNDNASEAKSPGKGNSKEKETAPPVANDAAKPAETSAEPAAPPPDEPSLEELLEVPVGIFGPQFTRRDTEDLCFAMGMSLQEVGKLIAIFNDIDVNCSGLINLVEFYHLLDSPQNAYTLGVLRLAPARKDPKKLEIDDFVEIICKFVRMRPREVVTFCFETFDEDESGALDPIEFLNMCAAIQVKGKGFFDGNFRKAMASFDKNNDGLLDHDEFQEINVQFPLVFYPLFQFQNKMLQHTLGWWKWYQITYRERKIDMWRKYMHSHLGREPPITLEDQLCSCLYKTSQMRLVAAQLYKTDQMRLTLEAKRAALPIIPKAKVPLPSPNDKYKQRSPSKKQPIQPLNPIIKPAATAKELQLAKKHTSSIRAKTSR